MKVKYIDLEMGLLAVVIAFTAFINISTFHMTRMQIAHAGTLLSRKSCVGMQIWQTSFSVLWDTP